MYKLGKLLSKSKSDLSLLVITFILLNLIRFGLFILPFYQLLKVLDLTSNFLSKLVTQQIKISQILHSVHTSNYYVFGNSKCLAKGLVTQILMEANGYSPKLKIGVAKENDGKLQAHAWVECNGKIVIGGLPNLSVYKSITSI